MKALIFDCFGVLLIKTPSQEKIFQYEWKINQKLIDFIAQKRHEGMKIAILSNVAQYYFEYFFSSKQRSELFDIVCLSDEINLFKPDERAFLYVANELGVLAEDCLMIDDSFLNIQSAQKIGMTGYVYENYESFQKFMKGAECQNCQK